MLRQICYHVKALRDLPYKNKGLNPMKKVFFEEFVSLPIIAKFNTALLKMANPIAICILNMTRQTLIYLALLHLVGRKSWKSKATNVRPQGLCHELEAAHTEIIVYCFLVNLELGIWASFLAKEKFTEGEVKQLDRRGFVFWNIQNRVQSVGKCTVRLLSKEPKGA